jgi:hypothetical protein
MTRGKAAREPERELRGDLVNVVGLDDLGTPRLLVGPKTTSL